MKGAILEVLLVSAKGIHRSSIIGKRKYHVIVECGPQTRTSKTTSGGHGKIYWNQKFSFGLIPSELEALGYLKFRIVNEKFTDDDGEFVGETIIFLEGIISEGNQKGVIELLPAPYNVVMDDDSHSYKGQITIGLKFIPNASLEMKRIEDVQEENHDLGQLSICKTIFSFWQIRWWKLLFSQMAQNSTYKNKDN